MKNLIIGLTGAMGSGKGEVVKILNRFDFEYVTLSSIIREEAKERGLEETRDNLVAIGNEMRESDGLGVLAKRALEKIQGSGAEKWVIDGIRNPAEIDELRKGENVHIIGIKVCEDLLVERIMGRNRAGDQADRDEILKKIKRELGEGQAESGQQLAKCIEKADAIIDNEGTLQELEEKFLNYYNLIRK